MNKDKKYFLFTDYLINWHKKINKRIMPWKEERNIYKIWISEVILQQTRVEQGIKYYNKIIDKFPDIESLAKTSENIFYKFWEGLGYYSRAKNLLLTARYIHTNLNGQFPDNYDDLKSLKGIGSYTAAALASFAYDLPYAVVDGNVLRVLSRYLGNNTPIDTTTGKKLYSLEAQKFLDKKNPALYNQAIMDFGATVCTPKVPKCSICVMSNECMAFKKGEVNILPIKSKTLSKKKRFFTYFIFEYKKHFLIRKRLPGDIWEGLFEFYLVETTSAVLWKTVSINTWLHTQLNITDAVIESISKSFTQQLTHQNLEAKFIWVKLNELPLSLSTFKKQKKESIMDMAFPKLINDFIKTI